MGACPLEAGLGTEREHHHVVCTADSRRVDQVLRYRSYFDLLVYLELVVDLSQLLLGVCHSTDRLNLAVGEGEAEHVVTAVRDEPCVLPAGAPGRLDSVDILVALAVTGKQGQLVANLLVSRRTPSASV